MVTPVAINTIGWQYYIVFAVVSACIPFSVYFFFPETMVCHESYKYWTRKLIYLSQGRNLEEIDLMFKESPSPWATVRFANSKPATLPQESYTGKPDEKADHLERDD